MIIVCFHMPFGIVCFTARQHQRSLAPVMNDLLMIMMANDIWGWMGPNFFRHLSYS